MASGAAAARACGLRRGYLSAELGVRFGHRVVVGAFAGGRGPGMITEDGCAVEVYRLPGHEPDIMHHAVPTGARVLELGAGTGRAFRTERVGDQQLATALQHAGLSLRNFRTDDGAWGSRS